MTNPSQLDAYILDDVADALIYSDRSGTIMRWNRASAIDSRIAACSSMR